MFALIVKAKKINLIKLLLILKYYTLPLKWLKLGQPQETRSALYAAGMENSTQLFLTFSQMGQFFSSCLNFTPSLHRSLTNFLPDLGVLYRYA